MKLKLNQVNDDWVAGFIKQCEAMDIDPESLITEGIKQAKPVFRSPGTHHFPMSVPFRVAAPKIKITERPYSPPPPAPAPKPAPASKSEPSKFSKVRQNVKSTINKGVGGALAGTVGYQIAKDKYQEEPW